MSEIAQYLCIIFEVSRNTFGWNSWSTLLCYLLDKQVMVHII